MLCFSLLLFLLFDYLACPVDVKTKRLQHPAIVKYIIHASDSECCTPCSQLVHSGGAYVTRKKYRFAMKRVRDHKKAATNKASKKQQGLSLPTPQMRLAVSLNSTIRKHNRNFHRSRIFLRSCDPARFFFSIDNKSVRVTLKKNSKVLSF